MESNDLHASQPTTQSSTFTGTVELHQSERSSPKAWPIEFSQSFLPNFDKPENSDVYFEAPLHTDYLLVVLRVGSGGCK